jgi:hypothetical protein
MPFFSKPVVALLAVLAGAPLLCPPPAYADGAASTRNIIFGAAAAAGSLLVINHNKKVHERYAEDARRQAELEGERNDARAAYQSERRAYEQEAVLVSQYQRQVAVQQQQLASREHLIGKQRAWLASLKHELTIAQTRTDQPQRAAQTPVAPERQVAQRPAELSYGWGSI